ncbi:MAG: outer membrane lipoprotein-sorting protein [Spirochaetes bacterium]|nr:outer membrane lipoprotein-sorting protein [Spirochaetota bacterium]
MFERFTLLFASCFLLFFGVPGYSETDVQKGTRIMKMYDDAPTFSAVRATMNLTIYGKDGNLRFKKRLLMASRAENMGTSEQVEKFIAYFTEPAEDQGSSVLMLNYSNKPDEKFFYMKSIRKIKKIVGADKKLSFFGSDFSNVEVAKPEFQDFNFRALRETAVPFKGKELECYVVECTPKTEGIKNDMGYGKKIMYIEKTSLLVMKTDYYDVKMTKQKQHEILSFIVKNNSQGKKVYYTAGVKMINLKTGTYSKIIFTNYLFEEDAEINKDIFSIEYLTRRWW